MPTSRRVRDFFLSLHALHAVTRLMTLVRPPLERGMRWSTVLLWGLLLALYEVVTLQYRHRN